MDRPLPIILHLALFLSGLLGLAFVGGGALVINRADKLGLLVAGLAMIAVGTWGCVSAVRQALTAR